MNLLRTSPWVCCGTWEPFCTLQASLQWVLCGQGGDEPQSSGGGLGGDGKDGKIQSQEG